MFSPLYAPRISARTVLITCIPTEYMSETALRSAFDNVKRIWLNVETTELEELVKKRDEIAFKLEAAEVKLIKLADAARRKQGDPGANADADEAADAGLSGSVAAKWLDKSKRPTHRSEEGGMFGFMGDKVDTIDWCREQLAILNPKIEELQAKLKSGDSQKYVVLFLR